MSLLPKELIIEIIKKGNFNSAADIQKVLKEIMKNFIEKSLEAELDNQLGYEKYDKETDINNSRNGYSKKKVKSSFRENESAKFWLAVLNDLKNRGVKDILIASVDRLIGVSEAIKIIFPHTEYTKY